MSCNRKRVSWDPFITQFREGCQGFFRLLITTAGGSLQGLRASENGAELAGGRVRPGRVLEGGTSKPLLYPSDQRIDSRHLCNWGILYSGNIRWPGIVYTRSNRMFG